MISEIGAVDIDSDVILIKARHAYQTLPDELKSEIKNYNELENAEEKLADLRIEAVKAMISDLYPINLNSGKDIEEVHKIYNELSAQDQARVSNIRDLYDASKSLTQLQADAQAQNEQALKSRLRTQVDAIYGVTFYESVQQPIYIDERSYIFPYIGVEKSNEPYLRMLYVYSGGDWVFYKQVVVSVDGVLYTIPFKYFDINHDTNRGTVIESIDLPASATNIKMLRQIVESDKTIIRFEGDHHRFDMEISSADKSGINDVLKYWDFLN